MLVVRRIVQHRALAWAVVFAAASPIAAETTIGSPPALPPWPDQAPVQSVYLSAKTPAAASPASAEAPTPKPPVTAHDRRRLAPQRERHLPFSPPRDRRSESRTSVPAFGLPLDSLYTTGTALAVVVGLFLLCAWVVRRGARKSTAILPNDVVSVLGRVPLAARQFAELVRVGNKLVLLSVTPAGAEPLTEITDPVEIDRLLGLCRERSAHSSTAEFDQVFRQLADEAAPDGFLGDEAPPLDSGWAAATDAFAAYRGGAARG